MCVAQLISPSQARGVLTPWRADFKSKFNAIHREYSPIPRKFYGFCTSVTVSGPPCAGGENG